MVERYEYFDEPDEIKKVEKNRWVEKNNFEYEQGVGYKESDASRGVWVEHERIENIPLSQIDISETYVNGPEDFQHGSYSEMERGVRILRDEVQLAVDKGATIEHFRELDHQRGVDYMHGSQRVYETFYGKNAIQLLKIGDRYVVGDGGHHRLYVAERLGLHSIPARVKEKQL